MRNLQGVIDLGDMDSVTTTRKATGKTDDLLSLLREQSAATIPEMAAELGLTEDGINYHLKKLQQAGKLKRIGGRKKGHWKVVA